MHVYSVTDSDAGLVVHAVGKNTRMELARPASSSKAATAPKKPSTQTDSVVKPSSQEKGKDVDRSLLAATSTDVFSKHDSALDDSESEHTNSMEPPRPRAPSSRRSSNGSLPANPRSPSALPSGSSLTANRSILRSPSPAPLPAVHLPLSPKLASAIAPVIDKPLPSTSQLEDKTPATKTKPEHVRLYGDPASTPFFRRLCWSTDGTLLLTPAGLWEDPYANIVKLKSNPASEEGKKKGKKEIGAKEVAKPAAKPTVYIYSRANIARPPIAHLPGHQTTSIAIKFCPILWELRSGVVGDEDENDENAVKVTFDKEEVEMALPGSENREGKEKDGKKPASLFDLPYRMIYAVATLDIVFLYDTQQSGPICMFGNLHYAPFTDLSWSVELALSCE